MEKKLTYREYAALAKMPLEELSRGCELQVFRASGPGGQGVNTTDSAVRLIHRETGIVVVARESRSQWQNRQRCLRKLREALARRSAPPKKRVQMKVSRAQRERRLADKRHRAAKKQLRGRITGVE